MFYQRDFSCRLVIGNENHASFPLFKAAEKSCTMIFALFCHIRHCTSCDVIIAHAKIAISIYCAFLVGCQCLCVCNFMAIDLMVEAIHPSSYILRYFTGLLKTLTYWWSLNKVKRSPKTVGFILFEYTKLHGNPSKRYSRFFTVQDKPTDRVTFPCC